VSADHYKIQSVKILTIDINTLLTNINNFLLCWW